MKQKIFVHDKERVYLQLIFHPAHNLEQFVAALKKVDELSFASEKCRGSTEVAAHGTAHRRNNRRRRCALALRQPDAHDARAHPGNDCRMPDRRAFLFPEIAPHPRNAFAFHDVIGVNHRFDSGNGRDMPTHHDRGLRREFPRHAAHLAHLGHVHDNSGDADYVILITLQLALKIVARRKIEHRTGRGNIRLDHHDAPGSMKHAQREAALRSRHLIVIKLHRIDGAASELVILGIRSEDRTQQDPRLRSLRMPYKIAGVSTEMVGRNTAGMKFQFVSSSVSPHMPLLQS